jgi:hypothetical protein
MRTGIIIVLFFFAPTRWRPGHVCRMGIPKKDLLSIKDLDFFHYLLERFDCGD